MSKLSLHLTHCSQVIPFYDTSFFKYKNYFQGFFLPDDYPLDIKTLQQQQSQDPVLKTVYSWIFHNDKPEFLTPLITGTPFLYAYYKRFSQLFVDNSSNLISLYTTSPISTNMPISNIIHPTIRICLPFRCLKLYLINFLDILTLVLKLHIVHSILLYPIS